MLTDFLTELTKGLPGKWLERLFGPAFLFWAGGLLCVFGPAELRAGWERLLALSALEQVGWLVAALLVLNASAALMERLRLPLLRLLEGYWPWPLKALEAPLIARARRRAQRQRERWSALMLKREQAPLTPRERDELARLEQSRLDAPPDLSDLRPTALGNILRGVERRIAHRYGLDPVLLWPRLWLLLPEDARQEIAAARQSLDRLAEAWGWGLLFLLWTFWQPWAALVALIWMLLAANLARSPARTFAVLVQSAFDLYRWRLYEALRWPLPEEKGPTEIAAGQALTRYVQRGMV
ncbi:MAG: hypothetical protein ACPLYD_15665 [Anaerolineae bacterium]|jgi:hypothetical protein